MARADGLGRARAVTAGASRWRSGCGVAGLAGGLAVAAAAGPDGTQILLRFPDGGLPSERWRWFSRLTLVLVATATIAMAISAPTADDGYANLTYLPWVPQGLVLAVGLAALACFPVSMASVVVRYRRAGPVEREQIRWVAWAACAFVGIYLFGFIPFLPRAFTDSEAMIVITTLAYSLVPVAIGFAILRHRLYDIDVIISRTVVYGLLSAAFTAVYAGIVLGIGTFVGHQGGPVLTIAAAVTIALLFQPLRRRAQLFANRLVYGQRATPYQALSDFAGDMAGQLDLTEAVDKMVSVLAGATGADRAEAWIRVGSQLRPAAVWPHGATPSAAVALGPGGRLPAFEGESRAAAVQQGGELLGALSLQKPRNESLTSTEDELLQDLASQAGLVLRNAALIDELRASRRRLVEAQDAERRKIERNLHDGVQQQLIALTIQLGVLEESADDPAAVRQLGPAIKDGLRAVKADLRDLARASTRRCWPARASSRPCRPKRARPPCRSRSTRTASGATRRTPRPRCISAPWKRCKTSPNTRPRPAPQSASRAQAGASGSPSPTTEPGSTQRPPGMAPACREWPTG